MDGAPIIECTTSFETELNHAFIKRKQTEVVYIQVNKNIKMIKQTLSQILDKPNPLAKKTSNTPKQILVKILKKTNPVREAQTKHIQNPKQTLNKTLNKTNPA